MTVDTAAADKPAVLARWLDLSPAWSVGAVLAGAAAVIATALGFQYIGGYEPCAMCYYQRWAYYGAMGIGVAGVIAARALPRRTVLPLTLAAMGAALAAGAATALFHAGIEQGWWPGPASCTGGALPQTLEELQAMTSSSKPVVACDHIPWAFLGLSMAGWNTLLAAGLAGFAFWRAAEGTAAGRPAAKRESIA